MLKIMLYWQTSKAQLHKVSICVTSLVVLGRNLAQIQQSTYTYMKLKILYYLSLKVAIHIKTSIPNILTAQSTTSEGQTRITKATTSNK